MQGQDKTQHMVGMLDSLRTQDQPKMRLKMPDLLKTQDRVKMQDEDEARTQNQVTASTSAA